jgi:hypothetical protein
MADSSLAPQSVIETDDDIVAFNQAMRRRLIKDMTDEAMPATAEDRTVLLKALADSDRAALTNKKIGSQEKQGAADRQAALIIASLSQTYGKASPFEVDPGMSHREPPKLDSSQLPPVTLVEGETEIGLPTDTYQTFIERMDSKNGYDPAKAKAAG